ncbi:MAG: GNAT family N-acetyltransferase, partial [Dehalococcoidia bacterium]
LATRADAVFVAEDADELLGYLMILLPRWTDAAEVSDLAVHRPARRRGAGRALIDGAAAWARERELRALWVEPQGDAGEAIEFYLRLGFRVAGFNDRWNSNRDDEDGRQTVYLYLELS